MQLRLFYISIPFGHPLGTLMVSPPVKVMLTPIEVPASKSKKNQKVEANHRRFALRIPVHR